MYHVSLDWSPTPNRCTMCLWIGNPPHPRNRCTMCLRFPEVSVTSCHRSWRLQGVEVVPHNFSTFFLFLICLNNTFPFAFLKLVYSSSSVDSTPNFILKMCPSPFPRQIRFLAPAEGVWGQERSGDKTYAGGPFRCPWPGTLVFATGILCYSLHRDTSSILATPSLPGSFSSTHIIGHLVRNFSRA